MRKEIEQVPVDTKILKDHFRKGLEMKMNKLVLQGYVPVGGLSTHMNTHTKPLLGIDVHEFTQTMVKYKNIEYWVKETEEERSAYSDEQASNSLAAQLESLKKGITRDTQLIKQLETSLSNTKEKSPSVNTSFIGKIKHTINSAVHEGRKSRLEAAKKRIVTNKSKLDDAEKESSAVDSRLAKFYKSNPSVTKEILLKSR